MDLQWERIDFCSAFKYCLIHLLIKTVLLCFFCLPLPLQSWRLPGWARTGTCQTWGSPKLEGRGTPFTCRLTPWSSTAGTVSTAHSHLLFYDNSSWSNRTAADALRCLFLSLCIIVVSAHVEKQSVPCKMSLADKNVVCFLFLLLTGKKQLCPLLPDDFSSLGKLNVTSPQIQKYTSLELFLFSGRTSGAELVHVRKVQHAVTSQRAHVCETERFRRAEASRAHIWIHGAHFLTISNQLTPIFNIASVFRAQKSGKESWVPFQDSLISQNKCESLTFSPCRCDVVEEPLQFWAYDARKWLSVFSSRHLLLASIEKHGDAPPLFK